MNYNDLNNLLPEIISIAKKAGDFIRQEHSQFSYNSAEIKGLNDLVSYVDKNAELQIVDGLAKAFNAAGFIVEENTRSERKEYNWIVDPLDGTTNFIHGLPCFAVSIALESQGESLLGVVYEINRDECFYAIKSGGAFLNGEKIEVSKRQTLSESLIATGFPVYNFEHIGPYLACLDDFSRHTHGLRRLGAAAVDLSYLACGRVDAFFEYNLQPWDVAAGGLLVQEAGGVICDFSGGNNWLFGKQVSATNDILHQEFNKIIKRYFLT